MFNINGLASGLQTDTMIEALMNVERAPIKAAESRISKLTLANTAWTKLQTLAKTVGDKAAVLGSLERLYAPTTTSTNPDAVAVTGTAAAGTSMAFKVTSLASAGQSALTGFGSASDVIGAGTVTVTTAGGESKTLTLAAGATLADLASAVNGSGLARASVINTGDPTLKTEVLFTSGSTGTANEATVTFTGFVDPHATTAVRTATDAVLEMGTQTITRSSNTISDLVDGATLTLKATTTADVNVTSQRDTDAVAAKVGEFVDALNQLLRDAATFSKSDPTGTAKGALAGDARLRTMQIDVMRAVTSSYGDGAVSVLSQIGIRVERDGTLSFNKEQFSTALTDNPDGVADLLTRTATGTTSGATFSSATAYTVAGTYAVDITRAAERAEVTGTAFTTLAADTDFTFTVGTKTLTYSAAAGTDGTTLAKSMDSWLSKNGLGLDAYYESGALVVRSAVYGSAASFTVSSSTSVLDGTGTGVDVAGTIGGQPATGVGRILTADSGNPKGLALTISSSPTEVAASGGSLSLGGLTFNEGVGGFLSALMGTARDAGGLFPSALSAIDRDKRVQQENITALNLRLEKREANLRAKFAALEVALSKLQNSTPNFSAMLKGSNDD